MNNDTEDSHREPTDAAAAAQNAEGAIGAPAAAEAGAPQGGADILPAPKPAPLSSSHSSPPTTRSPASSPSPSAPPPPAPPSNFRPVTLCGLQAVLACFERRPAALKRLLFSAECFAPLEPVRVWMRERGLPVAAAGADELSAAAGHRFHGGVVARTERPLPGVPSLSDYEAWSREGQPLLFAENVADPVHLGSIARAAAATGLPRLLLSGAETLDAYFLGRVWNAAAGALDMLTVHSAGAPLPFLLRDLRPWFCTAAFTRPGGRRVDELKPICAPGRPLAIVIGGAPTGVSPQTGGKCEHLLHIPGAAGSTLYTPGDTAAYGLPWLLLRRDSKSRPSGSAAPTGFLAKKRAAKKP